MELIEKINKKKLQEVIQCSNIPIYDEENIEDIHWVDKFKKILKKYNNTVQYKQKNNQGRFFGNGLQSFPREIRKYCSNEFYVDIDIINCHPVLIENILINNNISIPTFLQQYNLNRQKTLEKYNLHDKIDVIKIINTDKCYHKHPDIISFHNVLYSDFITILKQSYTIIQKTKNTLGSFIATCLQNIENDILMIMFNKCKDMNLQIDVLVFDGFMIDKNIYFPELLHILQNEVYKKIKYNIKLIEKKMDTDWIPIINELDKNKDIIKYKKANELFNRPEDTTWDVVKSNKGYKCIPQCKLCLVDPLKEHNHDDHSSLFINNDKSVIKSCFSCGSEVLNKSESKKAMSVFNIILHTQENTVYQELVSDLLIHSKQHKYKREKNTGIVYKQVKPYAYVKHLEPMDFLNTVFYGIPEFKSNVNNMDNLIKFMKQYDDEDFPFLQYDKDYIGFSNGILNIKTCEFIEDEESITVYKYIDKEFKYSMDTPLFDIVLNYQFEPDVRDFIYACLGRMFGIRDNYGFMLYLLGEPGCGKSLVLDILCECFNNIGSISSTFEEKFGLSFLYDKDIIVSDDLPKNISQILPQQSFQTMCTGGKVSIAVKGGTGFTVDWKVPMIFASNYIIEYRDKGEISRRMIVANFEKNILNPDPTFKSHIIQNELPAFIYKCLTYYKNMLENNTNKDIWKICPEYFLDQQQDLKVERNPLYKFLLENTRYKEGEIILLEEVRKQFNNWLGKNVRSLDNGTFFQVNKDYIIEIIKVCKHCNKESKKGCCELYKHSDRTRKTTVKNLEFFK